MDIGTPGLSTSRRTVENISLSLSEDGSVWIAEDEDTGVTSQGVTREEALEKLDEAVALHTGEVASPVTDDDRGGWSINPESVPDELTTPDGPWFDDDGEH